MKLEADLIDQYKSHTLFLLKVCTMVSFTNSANGQLPRGQLHSTGEQITTEPWNKVNRNKHMKNFEIYGLGSYTKTVA